ncbi:CBS domain-containing protein [Streptomyces mirabilis]|uniref:CBS domain-containing protein n=1 Tax=Streptomyces mirabilis TaxID=68239 RepID=UPI00367DC87C
MKPDDNLGRAVEVMREHFVRRVPVVDKTQQAVGVVSIGDLAIQRRPGEVRSRRPQRCGAPQVALPPPYEW